MLTGQKLLQRRGRYRGGIAALGAIAVVAVAVGLGIYIFGGKGAASTHGKITTATLVRHERNRLYTIDPSSSQASFTIHENHFGQPNDVLAPRIRSPARYLVNKQESCAEQAWPDSCGP